MDEMTREEGKLLYERIQQMSRSSKVFQVLLDRSTIECMGVKQVNHEQLMMSVVQECINACGSDFGTKLIKQHFGIEE